MRKRRAIIVGGPDEEELDVADVEVADTDAPLGKTLG
jgi:hypothetical protein